MTGRGKVHNGSILLDPPDALPEGAEVEVHVVTEETPTMGEDLTDKLLRLAGTARGLPHDLARNHDHYLHGRPRK